MTGFSQKSGLLNSFTSLDAQHAHSVFADASWLSLFVFFLAVTVGSSPLLLIVTLLLAFMFMGCSYHASLRIFDQITDMPAGMPPDDQCEEELLPFERDELLTNRERCVARLIRSGMNSAQVAALLGISASTVRNHLQHVYLKLGIMGIQELRELPCVSSEPLMPAQLSNSVPHHLHPLPIVGIFSSLTLMCLILLSPYCLATLPRVQSLAGSALGLAGGALAATRTDQSGKIKRSLTILILTAFIGSITYIMASCIHELNGFNSYYANIQDIYARSTNSTLVFLTYIIVSGTVANTSILCFRALVCSSNLSSRTWLIAYLAVSVALLLSTLNVVFWLSATLLAAMSILIASNRMAQHESSANQESVPLPTSPSKRSLIPPLIALVFGMSIGISELIPSQASNAISTAFALISLLVSVLLTVRSNTLSSKNAALTLGGLLFCLAIIYYTLDAVPLCSFLSMDETTVYMFDFFSLCISSHVALLPYNELRGRSSVISFYKLFLGFAGGIMLSILAAGAPLCLETWFLKMPSGITTKWFEVCLLIFALLCLVVGVLSLWYVRTNSPQNKSSSPAAKMHSREDHIQLFRECGLNETESKVLNGIIRGLSGNEIAAELSYSIGTVNSARLSGYRHLGIHSAEELKKLLGHTI